MRVRMERDVFADAVTWAARVVPSRPQVPVLAGLRLTADAGALSDGTLTVSGFDYETSAQVQATADVSGSGRVVVSGRLLTDIAKSLPARPVDMVTDGTRLRLSCGGSKFSMLTMPEEYPELPGMPDVSGTVAADLWQRAVSQVAVTACRDETLPILTSVYIEADGDTLTLLATDRYRLAVRTIPWRPLQGMGPTALLVKARVLADTAKTMSLGADVGLSLTDDRIGFTSGTRQTTSLLIDGDYPKVRALLPTAVDSTAVVSVPTMLDAVKRVALVAEANTPVRLVFTDGQVSVEAGRGEDADGVEVVEASVTDGITVSFNPGFLTDGLSALSGPFARFSFKGGPSKPAVLTGQPDVDAVDDRDYRYLLMPVRMG